MTISPSTEKAAASYPTKNTATAITESTHIKEFDMTQCNQNRTIKAPKGFTQGADEFAPDGLAGVWTSPRRFTNDGYVIETSWLPESGFEYEVYRRPGHDGYSMNLDGVRDLRDALTELLDEAAAQQGDDR
ncbi:hypothetical protein [Arthrobacter sp. NPDC090010]|uniref:hypothetical protein n=1 Tax=Arthrobacter sp. NPDC090010 TaxID=3363942 RepID=UPI0037FA2C43